MNNQTLDAIGEELRPLLTGRRMGKVFQLARLVLAIDFRREENRYLLISVEPNQSRMYLIRRTVRELEKQSLSSSPFALTLRKHLGGATLRALTKDDGDRIVRFAFDAHDLIGDLHTPSIIAQLTGRTANLFLLDEHGRILDSLRPSPGTGHEIGDLYEAPANPHNHSQVSPQSSKPPFERGEAVSLSDAADAYYRHLEQVRSFDQRAAALMATFRKEIEKGRKLKRNFEADLTRHGDPEEHKRIGDLLLANIAIAERHGSIVRVKDYYAEDAPTIELEIDEHRTLPEEAAHRFARYTKAKHAHQETARRLDKLAAELATLEAKQRNLARIIEDRDETMLDRFADEASGKGKQRGASDAAKHRKG